MFTRDNVNTLKAILVGYLMSTSIGLYFEAKIEVKQIDFKISCKQSILGFWGVIIMAIFESFVIVYKCTRVDYEYARDKYDEKYLF